MAKQTINSLPASDVNFMSDLNDFLSDEFVDRERLHYGSREFVVSGGIGTTDASLTHTISACIAFPNSYYVSQTSVSHTYTATKDTYVYLRDDDARTIAVSGYTITYDSNFVFAEYVSGTGSSQPATPTGCLALFKAITDGTSITDIVDYRQVVSIVSTSVSDHSVTATVGSLAYILDKMSGTDGVIEFPGNRVYTITANDVTIPAGTKIVFQVGAKISIASGRTLSIDAPEDIIASPNQQIFDGDGSVSFTEPGILFAEWWGAAGDGTTDDSDAVQSVVDILADVEGGILQLLDRTYALIEIEFKSFVTIRGMSVAGRTSYVTGSKQNSKTTFLASGTGDIITTSAATIEDVCLENINFQGLGAGTVCRGLYLQDCDRSTFRYLTFDNFSAQAIRIDQGVANKFDHILAQNCLLDRTHSAKIGVIDIGSSADNFLDTIEATPSLSAISSANLYLCAFAFNHVNAANNFVINCVGEFADIGFYVAGSVNGFSNVRADLNYGHGFQLISGAVNNRFSACFAYRNSNGTTNTYDGFHIESGSVNNVFSGCVAANITADGWVQRYGYYDALNSGSQKNYFSGCIGLLNATGTFYGNQYLGSSFPIDGIFEFTADDATPSVNGGNTFWFIGYTSATDITDFDDGTPNQIINVIDKNSTGYITIKNNANIVTTTGVDVTLTQNEFHVFIHDNGVWREI